MPLGAFKAGLMGASGATAAADVVLLSSQTASNSSAIEFTSGIDSTYGEYIFKFYNLNPATDGAEFVFQFNASGQSGFNEAVTYTHLYAAHAEDDGETQFQYDGSFDSGDTHTSSVIFAANIGNGGDESAAGELHVFNPSNTTYVTNFNGEISAYYEGNRNYDIFIGGYVNATAAIDEIEFKMSTGNFDGKIKMWGVK